MPDESDEIFKGLRELTGHQKPTEQERRSTLAGTVLTAGDDFGELIEKVLAEEYLTPGERYIIQQQLEPFVESTERIVEILRRYIQKEE